MTMQTRGVHQRWAGRLGLSLGALLVSALCVVLSAPASGQRERQRTRAETGLAIIGVSDGAEVYIDGRKITLPPSPAAVILAAPGLHNLRVAQPGFAPYVDSIEVRDGEVSRMVVELVPTSGVLRLKTNADKARVFIDGTLVGEAPLQADLREGRHRLRITHPGYKDAFFSIDAIPGQVEDKEVKLKELPRDSVQSEVLLKPRKHWYERWWVWTLIGVAATGVAVGIAVPAVSASRSACQRFDADVCIPIHNPSTALFIGGRF